MAIKLENVKQFKIGLKNEEKMNFLYKFYNMIGDSQAMIFVNHKETAEKIIKQLARQALVGKALIGKMDNSERDKVIDEFRRGSYPVLVATNVLARGIDVAAVDIVINFDPAMESKYNFWEPDYANYLHRIGRTGRFGTDGMAITFYDGEVEESIVNKTQAYWESEIKQITTFDEFMDIYKIMRPGTTAINTGFK